MGRLDQLPPYLFSAIDAARDRARDAGVDVVDLGVGDPDRPTPAWLLETMSRALQEAHHHRYPSHRGLPALRRAAAEFVFRRDGVALDPDRQVQVLIGSKEGLAHLPFAVVEPGDAVLVPDPGYPVYTQATILAGAEPRPFALRAEHAFRPDRTELQGLVDERVRLLYLNYPNNPTGAGVDADFWRETAAWAGERGIVLVNDGAYLEVALDGSRPASLIASCDPGRDRVVEFHSLSKMFNMTGWRVGFAVGHPEVIARLGRVKESIDSGVFGAIQEMAALALGEEGERLLPGVMAPYAPRRARLVTALTAAGVEVFPTAVTFYVWARVPGGGDSLAFCARLLDEIGVVATPGVGFGSGGEGWFRMSLTAPDERIDAAARRLAAWDAGGR
ncbi:MAG: aminotransferase class I/II-fold pyridoxal phosphate-dependent enzyme [Candidatus Krumholzibacteriia bacterium]